MFLLDIYQIASGAIAILIALVLVILLFKFFKGIIKFIISIVILGLIALGICFLLGVI